MEQPQVNSLKQTTLYQHHLALGAKIVPFAGWQMPLHYRGLLHEHRVVREKVGLFDVSHMGRMTIEGLDVQAFVDWLVTADVPAKQEGQVFYALLCNQEGGVIDDVLIIKESTTCFHLVANASNREKVYAHFIEESPTYDVIIEPSSREGILALQGPLAEQVAVRLFPTLAQLPPHRALKVFFQETPILVSRTGYTGEDGFEFFVPEDTVTALWETLLAQGAPEEIEPIGLGARDTLRLEMGYALYGHELNERISPLETVAAWAVQLGKTNFRGKGALTASSSSRCYPLAIVMDDASIPREGYAIYREKMCIGQVTSGTYSPSLGKGIALGRVDSPCQVGEKVFVEIRNQKHAAEVVKLPFYQRRR